VSKQKIERILVPIDGSDNAFRAASFAIDLATKYSSELILLYAFDLNQIRYSIGLIGVGYPSNIVQIKESVAKEAAPWFERVQKEADSAGVAVKTDVIDAVLSVVEEILDYADRRKIDLIVIGSKGRTGFKKLLLGSITSGLITHASCPVMVIK
jgi:nucleotide-binding universal stress UspA family protein